MKTTNKTIIALVDDFVRLTNKKFPNKNHSIYLMGSLARGGFSQSASDIDLGVIFKNSTKNAKDNFEIIKKELIDSYPSVKNNISIFYGSIEFLNEKKDEGRYPPFDRLDLIDHGLLLWGTNLKEQLLRPSKEELLTATANFALDYLMNASRLNEFKNRELIVQKGLVYLSKTILFPVRFIYFERNEKISGNDVSVEFYLNHFKSDETLLVKYGYELREREDIPANALELLDKYLIDLYTNFLDIYIETLEKINKPELRKKFIDYKRNILHNLD